ncbi:MAG TPA: prolyl oligopeptidase family serine peptidase [Rhodanobacteraceae bacterium]|nr:prolyl oligopeptidase family serine peptidase [Rhodanobacteraceae bacterium]
MFKFRLQAIFCFAGLLLLGAATANAAELPIKDFVQHPTLRNPVLSPDGKYIAVVVSENNDDINTNFQLAVLHLPDLKPVSRLSMAPRYTPINVHWVSNTRLIMETAVATGTLVLPSSTGDVIAVDFDGSHKKLLYSVYHRGNGVHSLDIPRGSPAIAGIPHKRNGHFYLSLSRMRGVTGDYWHDAETGLYNVDADNGAAVKIGGIDHGGMEILQYNNVARIAVGEDNHLNMVGFYSKDGEHWTKMPASTIGKTFEPLAISHDGSLLYALSSMDGGPNALISCNLDGSDREVLASDPFSSVTDVMWNPVSGVPIAAIFGAGGRPVVKYLNNDPYAQIMRALGKGQPNALVTLDGASTDGNMLLLSVHSDRNPGDYALFDKTTMHARPLYAVQPWIKPAEMAHRMPIHFKSRDGIELVGFLTLPVGQDKNLPLVVIPHGGPIGPNDSWFYDPWAALLANRGYATLQINYRGSGQRGENFQRSGYKQFATGIQNDLVDGVKWVIAHGYVNPNRICVFGASFGGYSSLMQPIVAPKLYKCAVDYAGVYDWRIGMDRSDTRRYAGGRNYFEEAVGTRDDAYAMSPVSMMDRFNVPVLIAHGKDDPRVPFQNATDLRSYLNKANKPYEWLAEPKELHGFQSEKHNEELWNMILPFLAKYIGPGNTTAAPAASGK